MNAPKPVALNGNPTVIVEVNTEEKMQTTLQVSETSKLSIYLGNDCSPDGRLAQPTTGRLIAASDPDCVIPPGSYICFHHNACVSSQMLWERGNIKTYRIQYGQIYCYRKPGELNTEMVPVYPFCIGERQYEQHGMTEGGIFLPFKKKKDTIVKIVSLPDDDRVEGLKEGDLVLMIPKSDYEINYMEDGTLKTIIRINIEEDILGVLENK